MEIKKLLRETAVSIQRSLLENEVDIFVFPVYIKDLGVAPYESVH